MRAEGVLWLIAFLLGLFLAYVLAISSDLGAAHGGGAGIVLVILLGPVVLLLAGLGWWVGRQRLRREREERTS